MLHWQEAIRLEAGKDIAEAVAADLSNVDTKIWSFAPQSLQGYMQI